jgi:methylmalonyl-CoA epimerase
MFERIDHIGIAVTDLEEAIELYEKTFGMPVTHRETVAEQGVSIAMLQTAESHVELMQPTGEDTPVGRFIAKRGPGIHHIGYAVPDIEAALVDVKAAGLRLIDEKPRRGAADSRVAFLHPTATGGVLTELIESAH